MEAINEASFALVKDDVSLLKHKGELFKLAKQKVHETGYQYAKSTSRSKHFGECSTDKAEVSKKRKYISSTIRQGRINELTESIKSTEETIKLLLKQKEQYFNINKFQQAADVNSTILEKTTEKHKLERELRALQNAVEKSRKYKKKKLSKAKEETSSKHKAKQEKLLWSNSTSSNGSAKDGESSGADTVILSDVETNVHTVVLSDSSPDLFPDHPNENILQGDAANSTKNEQSPPASQLPCETSVEVKDFVASPR